MHMKDSFFFLLVAFNIAEIFIVRLENNLIIQRRLLKCNFKKKLYFNKFVELQKTR